MFVLRQKFVVEYEHVQSIYVKIALFRLQNEKKKTIKRGVA